MAIDFGLEGRVVLVTGAGGGIGSATALEAASQGASIAVLDTREEEAQRTAAEVDALGGTGRAFTVDVRDESSVEAAVDDIEASMGPIYGVVPCAGITMPCSAEEMPLEDWEAVIGVNLTGTFLTARCAARKMLQRNEGAMVLLGSIDSLGGQDGRAHYAATKHGVIGLARSLACDWGRRGIRVNVVCPGPVETPMMRKANAGLKGGGSVVDNLYLPRMPIGRLAQPEDEARAIVYLLSDYAAYITGAVMSVDGGMSTGYLSNFQA
jgi:NAD(P)-dependent dehydrogenase (short-subunit alcohol dehydrogenase family)